MALGWWIATGASAALSVVALVADRAGSRRPYVARRGRVPWHLLLIVGMLGTLICGLIAATGGFDMPGGYGVPRRF